MLVLMMESLERLNRRMDRPGTSGAAASGGPDPPGREEDQGPTNAANDREPRVPLPEPYAGEAGGCGRFLLNCELVFDLQPRSYTTDRAKIAFCMNLFRGRAAQWATALWGGQSSALSSFAGFSEELRRVFDHPVRGQDALNRLLSLRQGSGSVADFAISFRILAAESGANEHTLRTIFARNLSETLKDELLSRDATTTLEQLISLAITMDNRIQERERERGRRPSRPQFTGGEVSSPVGSGGEFSGGAGEPMQLGRARLTPSERERRFSRRLCLYCGRAGHYARNCPESPNGAPHQAKRTSW